MRDGAVEVGNPAKEPRDGFIKARKVAGDILFLDFRQSLHIVLAWIQSRAALIEWTSIAPSATGVHRCPSTSAHDHQRSVPSRSWPVRKLSDRVFPRTPSSFAKDSFGIVDGLWFKWGRHGIIETVQKSEHRDHTGYFHNLFLTPVHFQSIKQFVGHFVWYRRRRTGVLQRSSFFFCIQRACLIVPDCCELVLSDIEMERAVDLVRNTILAA